MGLAHIVRDHSRDLNLHELALPDPRTPLTGVPPVSLVAHQFRPERKRSALKRLRLMHGTAAIFQKFALSVPRYPETTHIPRAVNVAPLECLGGDIEESGETWNVLFGKIDEPLLLTTFRAAGLALKAQ
jgi:hypothetical protein